MKIAPISILILSVLLLVMSSCGNSHSEQEKLDKKTVDPHKKRKDSTDRIRPGDVSFPELPVIERPANKPGSDLDTLRPIKA